MVVWPFPVNWKDGYQVTFTFKTEILVSRTRREQRRTQRATARRQVEFTSTMWEDDFLRFKRLLAASIDDTVIMADAVRKATLSAATASADATLDLLYVPGWLVAGRRLVVVSEKTYLTCIVQSVAGTTVTLTDDLGGDMPAGAMVYAGMVGRLPASLRYEQSSSRIGSVKVQFEVTPGSEPLLDADPLTTFNSREVWLRKPNWRDGVSVENKRDIEILDYGSGVTEFFSQQDFTAIVRDGTWVVWTTDQATELQGFFERMRGRQGEFYAPRWEQDMVLATPLTGGQSTMRVAGAGVAEAYAGDTVHQSLLVALRDGTNIFRKVSAIAADGDESVLTMSTTWPTTVSPDDVLMVTWMPVCRFATDDVVFDWITSEVGQVKMSHMALEALTPET